MDCASVMANLIPGRSNAAAPAVASDLSERFHAHVVGVAAGPMATSIYDDGYVAGSLVNQDRDALGSLVQSAGTIGWRGAVTFKSLAAYVAGEARSADLLVTSAGKSASARGRHRRHRDAGRASCKRCRPGVLG